MKMLPFTCTSALAPNQRDFAKPNEDRLFADAKKGVFAVFDGVTRPHDEYDRSDESLAAKAAEAMTASVEAFARALPCRRRPAAVEALLREALLEANLSLTGLVPAEGPKPAFLPGAVGIAAVLCGSTLVYAFAGDSSAALLRNGALIRLARPQTASAALLGFSKDELYRLAANKSGQDYCYGLFNGDPALAEHMTVSHIQLEAGDRVFLFSDGLSAFFSYANPKKGSAGELIAASVPYDKAPYAAYADDKALICLDF